MLHIHGDQKSLLSLSEGSSNHAEHNTRWDESANRPNQLRGWGDCCNAEKESSVYIVVLQYIIPYSIVILYCIYRFAVLYLIVLNVCVYICIHMYIYTCIYKRYLSLHTHVLSLDHVYCYSVLRLTGTIAIHSVIIIFIITSIIGYHHY